MANYQLASRRLLHERARRRTRRHWFEFLALLGLLGIWYVTLAPSSLKGPVTYAVVSGHSMEPSLYTGDLVVVRSQSEYHVGDTVLTSVMGGLVIHRIVWISKHSVRTKGINNDVEDTWTLPLSAILGKQEFVFKQVGSYLVQLRTNPLVFGSFAATVGALMLIDPRRRRVSDRLKTILNSAEKEIPQIKKNYLNSFLVGLYVLSAASLLSTGILLANHANFYPRMLLSLSGVVVSIIAFEVLGNWLALGKDLKEPDRSIAAFRRHLYRVDSRIEIPGQTKPVEKALELLKLAEVANTPILHMISEDESVHQFWVVTDDLNYLYVVHPEPENHPKAKHKK